MESTTDVIVEDIIAISQYAAIGIMNIYNNYAKVFVLRSSPTRKLKLQFTLFNSNY